MAKVIPVFYKGVKHDSFISDEDYATVMSHRWRLDSYGYAVTTVYDASHKRLPNLKMHRLVLNAKVGEIVDHIDGNTLNNQRVNLRICTQSDNLANSRKKDKRTSSKYKGVYWDNQMNKWRVRVTYKGKTTHVGLFDNETEAARAYNAKATEVFKEYAALNKVN